MAQKRDTGAPAPLIATLGDLILDVIVLPQVALVPDGDTPAQITLTAGGQAANVAAWVAELGGRARLICVRGSDGAAAMAAAELERHGVAVVGPQVSGSGGTVVSTREPDGGRTMASDAGVAGQLSAEQIDPGWVSDADVLHVSGYALLRDPIGEAAIALAGHARRVSLDLASAHDIELVGIDAFRARVERLAPDLIFANRAEHALLGDVPAEWVIKDGADGAIFPQIGHLPAPPVAALDTTGAGDALAAGYLVSGPETALSTAARCVAQVGAMPTRPT